MLTRDAISQKDAVLQALQTAMTRIRTLFQGRPHANVSATDQLKNELDDALLRLGLLEYQDKTFKISLSVANIKLRKTRGVARSSILSSMTS